MPWWCWYWRWPPLFVTRSVKLLAKLRMAIIFRCKFVISNHISSFSARLTKATTSPIARNPSPHQWQAELTQVPAKPVTWIGFGKRDLNFINVAAIVIAVTVADNHQRHASAYRQSTLQPAPSPITKSINHARISGTRQASGACLCWSGRSSLSLPYLTALILTARYSMNCWYLAD